MLGAIYGDIIGSYYEVHCTKDYDFPLNKESHFTDDSVLTVAVCRAILNFPDDIKKLGIRKRAKEYAATYRHYYSCFPGAGFGNMFSRWAKSHDMGSIKSYANGGAMRVVPIGYAYDTEEQVLMQVKASCMPTHKHKEAITGAGAVAMAVFLARKGKSKEEIKSYIEKKFGYDLSVPLAEIKKNHIFDSRASYSVPSALIAFLESADYESAVRNAVSLGGDADTEACIAGGIAQAFYKEIPDYIRRFCESRLDSSLKKTAREFCGKYIKIQEES